MQVFNPFNIPIPQNLTQLDCIFFNRWMFAKCTENEEDGWNT